jgi:hypothetical protein
MFSGTNPSSDIITILKSIGAYSAESVRSSNLEAFCQNNYLNYKSMQEIHKLRCQLTKSFNSNLPFPNMEKITVDPRMAPPSTIQQGQIRQILLSGFNDQMARLNEAEMSGHGKNALPLYETLWSTKEEEFVIHPSIKVHLFFQSITTIFSSESLSESLK